MSLWTALETVEVRIRRGWRIRADSIFIDKISQAVHLHQTVTSQNRDWTEEPQIEIAPLSKLLWVAVCLQASSNAFCRGSHQSHRDAALWGRCPLDFVFPIAYIDKQVQHLRSRSYESIRVGVSRKLPARPGLDTSPAARDGRSDRQAVLFDFRNPTAEDHQFYDSIANLALEADGAQPF